VQKNDTNILYQQANFVEIGRRTPNEKVRCFYRAMHFSAKRGIAIACRMSVCL